MSTPAERVAATCPSCSPDHETAHEVLKPGGNQATVRCTACGHVHKTAVDQREEVERKVVVSQEGESFTATVNAPADETVAIGEEFLLETDEAILTVRITDLQTGPEQHVEEATVEDVETFFTRAVGNVSVDLTLHPKGGAREGTRSIEIQVPGDEEFVVGETTEYGDEEFTVEGVVVREDARGYERRKFDFDGDSAVAKDIQRIYARDESSTAWSAW